MWDLLKLLADLLATMFKPKARLEAEIIVFRHQLNVLHRAASRRPKLTNPDRLVFVWLYRWFPDVLQAVTVVRPETVVRWHRGGFRLCWRWKSRRLVREMSLANPLWGAPRIHGELLKLGITISQTTVAKYTAKGRRPPSQTWKTFLRNHAAEIVAVDLFVVPTIGFRMLFALIVMGHDRRKLLSFGVTTHPTAEWIAGQITALPILGGLHHRYCRI